MATHGVYCRRCGYDLRTLPAGKCPECAADFDPADSGSYRTRPPRTFARRLLIRTLVAAAILVFATGGTGLAFYGAWRAERSTIAEVISDPINVHMERIGPAWLQRALGRRFGWLLERATWVGIGRGEEQRLSQLGRLKRVHRVDLAGLDLEPGVWEHLQTVKRLDSLFILDCRGDSDAWSGLSTLHGVDTLFIASSTFDDAAVPYLGALPKLRVLYLSENAITDEGVGKLGCLQAIVELDLTETPASDRGLSACVAGLAGRHKVTMSIAPTAITRQRAAELMRKHSGVAIRAASWPEHVDGASGLQQ